MKYFSSLLLTIASLAYAELEPLPRFDWSSLIEGPSEKGDGNQILHFNTSNKAFENNPQAVAFKNTHLYAAVSCESDAEVLRVASDAVQIDGLIIEVGTKAGKNANFLAALNPKQTIYSFDSPHGLPQEWVRSDWFFPAGYFGYHRDSDVPPVLKNVLLFRGPYAEMLSQIDKRPIALLHVDCEIYTSTKDTLTALGTRIQPGTIIVFDEAYNYPDAENHEWKAFQEFCQDQHLTFQAIAYNRLHEQVAVLIQAQNP